MSLQKYWKRIRSSVAKFIVLDGGIKLTPAWGCRTGLPGYIGWHSGTTTLCRVNFIPCSLAGRYDNPMPESTLSLQSGNMNLGTGLGQANTFPNNALGHFWWNHIYLSLCFFFKYFAVCSCFRIWGASKRLLWRELRKKSSKTFELVSG